MDKSQLLTRLRDADPGWPEWDDLIVLVQSLEFDLEDDENMGKFLQSGARLTFADHTKVHWPDWLPSYVPALYGMKAEEYIMAGGFADAFDGSPTEAGSVFCLGGVDQECGFPMIPVPEGVFNFQMNSSGALFHINADLIVLYPNSEELCLKPMDELEAFALKNIRQVLANKDWFEVYKNLPGTLMD